MKRILYLPIEIIERELDAKLLIAVEALNRGYSVYIGHFRRIEAVALSEKAGIYFYKAMTDQNGEKLFIPLKKAGLITVALDEEGLVWPSLKYYSDTRIGRGDGLASLDLIFTWGEEQREHIIENHGVPENRIITSGNPRFDILKEPYREIYRDECNKIKTKYGAFVLVNTNFGPANFSRVFGRTWLEHLTHSNIIKTSDDLDYYKARASYYEVMIKSYIVALKKLAKTISPINIIIRPHPSEEHSTWVEAFKGDDNIKVIYEGSSKPWIMASSCVIHSGCTTGLEAFAMGVPVIRYNVTGQDDMESPLPNVVSEFCANYSDLERMVLRIIESSSYERDPSKFLCLSRRLLNISNTLSYKIILDELEKRFSLVNTASTPNCEERFPLIKSKIDEVLSKIEEWILGISFIKESTLAQRVRLRRQRFSGLFESQVLGRAKGIMKTLGVNDRDEIFIKRVASDVYYLGNSKPSATRAT